MSPLRLISDASRPLFLTAFADPGDSSCNLNLYLEHFYAKLVMAVT